jgi:hypothetical protein
MPVCALLATAAGGAAGAGVDHTHRRSLTDEDLGLLVVHRLDRRSGDYVGQLHALQRFDEVEESKIADGSGREQCQRRRCHAVAGVREGG